MFQLYQSENYLYHVLMRNYSRCQFAPNENILLEYGYNYCKQNMHLTCSQWFKYFLQVICIKAVS